MTIEVDSIIFIILSSIQVNKLEPGKWKNMPKLPWPAMVKPGEISGSKIVCSHFVIEAVDSNPWLLDSKEPNIVGKTDL